MDDPTSFEDSSDPAIAKVMRSDLSTDVKRAIVLRLIAEREAESRTVGDMTQRVDERIAAMADQMVKEAEQHLRDL